MTEEHSRADILSAINEVRKEVASIKALLHGDDAGNFGILQKVSMMWRIHIIWPACTLSAIFGAILTIVIQHIGK